MLKLSEPLGSGSAYSGIFGSERRYWVAGDIRELGAGWAWFVNERRMWQDMDIAHPAPEVTRDLHTRQILECRSFRFIVIAYLGAVVTHLPPGIRNHLLLPQWLESPVVLCSFSSFGGYTLRWRASVCKERHGLTRSSVFARNCRARKWSWRTQGWVQWGEMEEKELVKQFEQELAHGRADIIKPPMADEDAYDDDAPISWKSLNSTSAMTGS